MSTAWSYRFPYRGGDDVHVRRLPASSSARGCRGCTLRQLERGGGRWRPRARRRGRGEAQWFAVGAGRGVRCACCEAWKSKRCARSDDPNPWPFLPRRKRNRKKLKGTVPAGSAVFCTCADARRRPTWRLASARKRPMDRAAGLVMVGGQFCSCSSFQKKNSVPVQQPCFIAEVVEGGGWTKLEWPQRMGHLHGPTGVSQPIPFSGRQRGGKIS